MTTPQAETEALLPCPWCGANAKYLHRLSVVTKRQHRIVCQGTTCGAEGPVENTKARAIAAWNTRAQPKPEVAPDDEALIEKLAWVVQPSGGFALTTLYLAAKEALRRRFAELRATSLKYQLAFGDRDNEAHRLADRVAELEAEIRRRDLAADMKRRADELTDSLLKGADT